MQGRFSIVITRVQVLLGVGDHDTLRRGVRHVQPWTREEHGNQSVSMNEKMVEVKMKGVYSTTGNGLSITTVSILPSWLAALLSTPRPEWYPSHNTCDMSNLTPSIMPILMHLRHGGRRNNTKHHNADKPNHERLSNHSTALPLVLPSLSGHG